MSEGRSEIAQRPVTVEERCAAVAKAINEHPGRFQFPDHFGREAQP